MAAAHRRRRRSRTGSARAPRSPPSTTARSPASASSSERFEQLLGSAECSQRAQLWPPTSGAPRSSPTSAPETSPLRRTRWFAFFATLGPLSRLRELAVRRARPRERTAFLHWHVAFPASSGTGAVSTSSSATRPWERVKLQEKEFFAARSPEIADGCEQGRSGAVDQERSSTMTQHSSPRSRPPSGRPRAPATSSVRAGAIRFAGVGM